jgi:hypothetical protein
MQITSGLSLPITVGTLVTLVIRSFFRKEIIFHLRFISALAIMIFYQVANPAWWIKYEHNDYNPLQTREDAIVSQLLWHPFTLMLLPTLLFTWEYFDTVSSAVNHKIPSLVNWFLQAYIITLVTGVIVTWLLYNYFEASGVYYFLDFQFKESNVYADKEIKTENAEAVFGLLTTLTSVALMSGTIC